MLDDFSISAKQRLLTYFIDQEPGLGLTNDNVKLSLPRQGVFTDKNTEVTASFVNTLMYKPTTVGHYNRLNLQSYFKSNFGVEQPPLNSASDLSSVLAAVLAQYNVALTDEDISIHVGPNNITLIAKPSSYDWTGSVSFLVSSGTFSLDEDDGGFLQLDDDDFFELD